MRPLWDRREAEARSKVLAAGTIVTPVDRAAFAASVKPVLDKHLADPALDRLHDRVTTMAG